jgi:hypothetical protein
LALQGVNEANVPAAGEFVAVFAERNANAPVEVLKHIAPRDESKDGLRSLINLTNLHF